MTCFLTSRPRQVIQMNEIDFYTPPDIPSSIKAFDSEVRQLAVGAPGKNGSLRLIFQNDADGKTILGDQFSEVPLHVQKALYYDDSWQDLAYLYIISASGGILQGDRYRIDITMKKDSKAHITTQGATRIYHMDANSATQMINVTLEEDSYLEFIPDQIIPYSRSRFYQKMSLNVHDSATLVYSEIITPGRVAMGESFEYDICYLKTRAVNQEDVLRLVDVANLEPKRQRLTSFGILGDSTVVGSVYILTKKDNVVGLHEKLKGVISVGINVYGGASIIKDNSGVYVRILGKQTEAVKDVIQKILSETRHACAGFGFSAIRKN